MITAGSIAFALKHRSNSNKLSTENETLKNENYRLSNYKDRLKQKRGIIKRHFIRGNDSNTGKRVDFILEVLEISKTNTQSKIVIEDIKCLDINETLTGIDKKRVVKLVGDWVDTSEIEWQVNRTEEEIREDKIDDILNEEDYDR